MGWHSPVLKYLMENQSRETSKGWPTLTIEGQEVVAQAPMLPVGPGETVHLTRQEPALAHVREAATNGCPEYFSWQHSVLNHHQEEQCHGTGASGTPDKANITCPKPTISRPPSHGMDAGTIDSAALLVEYQGPGCQTLHCLCRMSIYTTQGCSWRATSADAHSVGPL